MRGAPEREGRAHVDGKLDVAFSTGFPSGAVGVALGNGDGTFQDPVTYATGTIVRAVAAGDLNNDGMCDLVVSGNPVPSSNRGAVGAPLGNGDGTFQSPVTSPTGVDARYLALGDFNNDGQTDAAVTYDEGVSVLVGNGDGSFQPPLNYLAGSVPVALGVGDFNQDGSPDLAAVTPQGAAVLLNAADWAGAQPGVGANAHLAARHPTVYGRQPVGLHGVLAEPSNLHPPERNTSGSPESKAASSTVGREQDSEGAPIRREAAPTSALPFRLPQDAVFEEWRDPTLEWLRETGW